MKIRVDQLPSGAASKSFELYLHIPFCVRKCGYCDFLSFPAGKDVQQRYVEALLREIRMTGSYLRALNGKSAQSTKRAKSARSAQSTKSAQHAQNAQSAQSAQWAQQRAGWQPEVVSSVFIGGGTPSVLEDGLIARIMHEIRKQFCVLPDAEITIEANPGTVDLDKLRGFRSAGINRISIGCQSMHDRELVRMGRIHDHAAFLQSFEAARKAGFDNINLDLISALPEQSLQDWRETLHAAAALEPDHISAYSLILEEGTPFYARKDTLRLPDEDTERAMYEETAEILSGYGFLQYELSNYAKPGRACRHNLGYWTGIPYLGMGLGAASYWPADAAGPELTECRQEDAEDRRVSAGSGQENAEAGRAMSGAGQKNAETGRMLTGAEQKKETARVSLTGDRQIQKHPEPWMVRFNRTSDLRNYLETMTAGEVSMLPGDSDTYEQLGKADCMAEFMILGLRLTEGVSKTEFRKRFQMDLQDVYGDILLKYAEAGLLSNGEDRVFLTRKGRSLANVVMMEFL